MDSLHISISAEPIAHIGSFAITNSLLTGVIVTCILIALSVAVKMTVKSEGRPSRFQSLIELIVESLRGLISGIAGQGEKAALFGPLIVSFFFFVLLNNWIGLLPGVGTIGIQEKVEAVETHEATSTVEQATDEHATEAVQMDEHAAESTTHEEAAAPAAHTKFVPLFRPATADLNATLALAIITMVLVQIFGVKYQKLSYFKKFIDFSSPINFIVGILETISEFAKIISFSFRLFGNIFAGEVLLTVMMYLTKVVVPMPFYGMEIFVGFIQALVFSILSLAFFNMATIGHHEEHS